MVVIKEIFYLIGGGEKVQSCFDNVQSDHHRATTSWPSGLRRYVKAVVFTGVGSNPIDVTFLFQYVVCMVQMLSIETSPFMRW